MARPAGPYATLAGRIALDRTGVRLGQVHEVLVDDVTGRPEWLVIATGVLGARQKVVPIAVDDLREALAGGAAERRHREPITIPVDHERVLSAPRVHQVGGQLTQDAEEALYLHYRLIADEPPTPATPGANPLTVVSGIQVTDEPLPPHGTLGEIARAASAASMDLAWLDRVLARLATDSADQDRERP